MNPLVIFDLETGGVEPHHPDIQLAALVVDEGDREVGAFHARVQFDEDACDHEALQMNSYGPELWKDEALPEHIVTAQFARFLDPYRSIERMSQRTGRPYTIARLAGHNAQRFDGPRLRAMYKRSDRFLPGDTYGALDTWQRALWWFHETGAAPPKSYKLPDLCAYFDIPVPEEGAHDARVDVALTAQLIKRLRE
jgi:DNA polymerase III epsilon subunit-like protein